MLCVVGHGWVVGYHMQNRDWHLSDIKVKSVLALAQSPDGSMVAMDTLWTKAKEAAAAMVEPAR